LEHHYFLEKTIQVNTLDFIFALIMIFTLAWLLCLSVSVVTSSVDALLGAIQRKAGPVLVPIKDILRGDSVALEFLRDLDPPLSQDSNLIIQKPDVTHFCFLIHGHRGLSRDLAYMQAVMKKCVAMEIKRRSLNPSSMGEDSVTHDTITKHDMVVHNVICNEGKTKDGVKNGGDRLVAEMRKVIEAEMAKRYPEEPELRDGIRNITVSILGNSLGGIYGRYAVAKLVTRHCVKENKEEHACWILDEKYRLHLNIFCTTATPHLGVSRFTYLPIPRTAEIGVAHAMGDTGRDLFRLNDLLHKMATCPTFLQPLANFRKRIAYANAYGTDFPVHAATAAFLSENSSYPHHFLDDIHVDHDGLFIATMHTPPTHNKSKDTAQRSNAVDVKSEKKTKEEDTDYTFEDELHHMSESLDSIGWKKVFIDIRKEIPTLELPKPLRKVLRYKSDSALVVNSKNCINYLREQRIVKSKDIASALGDSNDSRLLIPLGHNMIMAFSRSKLSAFMHKGGRPVVDTVAKDLVEDIFKWNTEFPSLDSMLSDIDSIATNNDEA
jgi:hypothetical protein